MFITLGIVTISALIIYFEMPQLMKTGETKTIWTFSILLFIGTALSIMKGLNVTIPNPLDLITILFKPFADLLKTVLKY
ncbi:hypothetical protein AEA09_08015 [Lysinibacillus contaminans]|uniref:Holin n=1 Tax=Lysinibacillus contaminans TaxID=1293441 RepID=A0ABR5K151_9BACI|nr:hypothetical protein [Lysinibacillus contaminans]KOS68498.1 hypothetical protein AEA09_08015 [Lysinibacillus contaminans]